MSLASSDALGVAVACAVAKPGEDGLSRHEQYGLCAVFSIYSSDALGPVPVEEMAREGSSVGKSNSGPHTSQRSRSGARAHHPKRAHTSGESPGARLGAAPHSRVQVALRL
jgi:hypothetical protein